MVKRNASEEVEMPFDLKKKKVSMSASEDQKGTLDCCSITDPAKMMQALLGDTKLEDFFENYWEKKPLLIKREDASFYGSMFSLSVMKDVLQKNELNFQEDVNVCRYVNGEKELLNEEQQITEKDVDRLIDEKQATFQFHHPQRYIDELWNMLEKMERYFGSLVGSNVYITPPDSQGLAPHCDDVEIFVLQLEGTKSWKLYKPMVELSRDYTQDLLQESIGEPLLEAKLEPGDMLYFPRGYIHQATAGSPSHSTHISISTYQQNTWGDFMNHAITQAIENALEDDVTTRSGLPVNYMNYLGTGKNMGAYVEDEGEDDKSKHSNLNEAKVKDFKEVVKKHLSQLVDHIDVNTAADAMSADFMASRLPPYGHTAKDEDEDEVLSDPPKLTDRIKIRYPEHMRVVYCDEDEDGFGDEEIDSDEEDMEQDDEKPAKTPTRHSISKSSKSPKSSKKAVKTHSETSQDDDDEDDEDAEITDTEPHIKIVHALHNDRFTHMGSSNPFDEELGCLKLHVSYAKAAIELLKNSNFVAVKDLLMDDDDDKVTLATTLFSDDLIEIKKE